MSSAEDAGDMATPVPEHPSAALALDADTGSGIAVGTSVWRQAPRRRGGVVPGCPVCLLVCDNAHPRPPPPPSPAQRNTVGARALVGRWRRLGAPPGKTTFRSIICTASTSHIIIGAPELRARGQPRNSVGGFMGNSCLLFCHQLAAKAKRSQTFRKKPEP